MAMRAESAHVDPCIESFSPYIYTLTGGCLVVGVYALVFYSVWGIVPVPVAFYVPLATPM